MRLDVRFGFCLLAFGVFFRVVFLFGWFWVGGFLFLFLFGLRPCAFSQVSPRTLKNRNLSH